MTEYRRSFIELIAPLENIPEPLALGQFINGLRPEVRSELRLHGAKSLDQAMDLALKVEDKLRLPIWKYPTTKSPLPQTGGYSSLAGLLTQFWDLIHIILVLS